ncbi:helix-turn-helix domain-containing protein [Sphingobium cloacae]|uniref:Chromosomal replication initiator DnaA C-terminal domain-containing protein n=1 Tax=Sphingobium cloacae TaxID=120107 RepID=A0A1E1F2N8_9SPHN|nr:helix-turn-helix domain-containing protein [Sphingobium cloacae]BAV64783.1 hypothetical protein SCLO_1017430 [Sphingobium cloacae]
MTSAADTAVSLALTMLVARIAGPAPQRRFGGKVRVADLIDTVAWFTSVDAGEIVGRTRKPVYFRPRAAVCWIACELGLGSTTVIGHALGGRDHTTVHHAVRRARALRHRDPAFRRLTDRLVNHFRDFQEN